MSSEDSDIAYYIQSRKDGNRLTLKDNKFVMAKRDAPGSEQRIIGVAASSSGGGGDTGASSSSEYRLNVYNLSLRLDFNPHDKDLLLFPSEPNTGQSQVWSLVEHQTDVWLIKSSYGGYLKNNGSGKAITIYKPKKERDLNDKSLQWLLPPAF